MKKLILAIVFLSGGIAHARDCELPHEWRLPECSQYFSDAQPVSAVQKKKDTRQIVADYKDRAAAYEAMVAKAEEDYRVYRASLRPMIRTARR
jgi:hypothetical protein